MKVQRKKWHALSLTGSFVHPPIYAGYSKIWPDHLPKKSGSKLWLATALVIYMD